MIPGVGQQLRVPNAPSDPGIGTSKRVLELMTELIRET